MILVFLALVGVTAVLGVLLPVGAMAGLILWVDWAGLPFLLFLIWTVVTSIVLLRRGEAVDPAGQSMPVAPASTQS